MVKNGISEADGKSEDFNPNQLYNKTKNTPSKKTKKENSVKLIIDTNNIFIFISSQI